MGFASCLKRASFYNVIREYKFYIFMLLTFLYLFRWWGNCNSWTEVADEYEFAPNELDYIW